MTQSPDDPLHRLDDPDLMLSELLRLWPETITVILRHGMLCTGCPIGRFHSIDDACALYRLDRAAFVAELRAAITPPGAPR